ncbi:cysteine desulfurase [Mesorhizobium sp. M1C.F.Ca.ET.193.01.1.1]|uniref:urate hydroxylase PuuD n=1 Tax=unclassified Mesorhizobium TaxID=325217 RepID=UPI000FD24F91|nr:MULTISPECIES: urate hydroxylase PuuD [unclassified Mesorhizobium]TGS95060.1 cysteine desulfurase [bacterium M00.F.Ca.ET.177.01.1.1]TGQ51399.1 cysteine desulfurase [Mesorhizobium sp. M1C.F.Ca.ET.210.01.1.1]TGQ67213.1 cysteine desulfurase [Mesorhizobium sp. M1C.F.Ca.ET.212.01.1.1]TGR01844.1 cysteine desulfurase [Mesorhizobium sp. M1C.F.Ca.ET.204.01.1.1]TGR22526.1 cysteine desulfurase [Mesorhizobium sp. M1C.F.Ca.ET.196.01.1.1]
MLDFAIFWDWLSFAVRWLHVITGIAWIGSSFYFVALDLGLRQRPGLPAGAFGEEWQVHGGGFYHIQKYLVAPAEMPEHLTWFKWESYATWLSGFAMLCVVYYAGADLFLIDPNVLNISVPVGILLSLATIGVGWIVYDLLCRSPLGKSDTGLMLVLYCVLVFIAWGLTHLFTGRAAFLHLGAITATIMSANVFIVIIPNQKIVVADLIAGRKPDPKYGKIAKQRSLHNNYLTLPVLFLMLSNHYPLAFGTEFNWVIASLVFIIGVLIRHYFNTVHARKGNPTWTWLGAAVLFMIIIWLSTVPKVLTGEPKTSAASAAAQVYIASAHFPAVRDTVLGRCSMCHTEEPVYEGIYHAPKGVMLDTDARIAEHAREIYLQAGRAHAMPPANVTQITDQERALLVAWFEGAGK